MYSHCLTQHIWGHVHLQNSKMTLKPDFNLRSGMCSTCRWEAVEVSAELFVTLLELQQSSFLRNTCINTAYCICVCVYTLLSSLSPPYYTVCFLLWRKCCKCRLTWGLSSPSSWGNFFQSAHTTPGSEVQPNTASNVSPKFLCYPLPPTPPPVLQ